MRFRKLKTGIVVVLISILISGCVSPKRLAHPVPQGNRIGVISNFRNSALFQRAGTTSVDNVVFYRRIPKLHMNALVTTTVANSLYQSRQFHVIPIYHATATDLLAVPVTKLGRLTSQYQHFISRLIQGKKLNTIVLVTPGNIDFGDGQYIGSIWWVRGYGLFTRSFVFMQTDTVFAGYNVYVINARNFRVLAKATGDLKVRSPGINIAWHRGYAGVTQQTLRKIYQVIRWQMPPSLVRVVHKTGLP